MNWMIIVLLLGGFISLLLGAEILVRGASRLAAAFGISPLVIGLTVVAFGTSAPELAINLQSAFTGQANIALGNVLGSNIMNVLVILGLSALIIPLVVNQQLVRQDVPIMIAVTILVWWMASDGSIGFLDGIILFAGLLAYIVFNIVQSRKETSAEVREEYEHEFAEKEKHTPRSMTINLGQVAFGLVCLTFGAGWLVDGAVALARLFSISELVIGLTIVAIGTSLPELATSVVAAIRKERDIAVGNVVGSNIFNLMAVLGLTGLIAPGGIPIPASALAFDIPVMVAVAVITLPVFFTGGHMIFRWEGGLFVALYAIYVGVMLSDASGATKFQDEALLVIAMITGLVLAGSALHELLHRRKLKQNA
ncbi:MAG TPA: sodium:calcium antiporter [Anaerolineae bacterium]|jgi:cation:H+ antiporter|nr:sodium:calcium antiporter [Anaerolineae bacterium]